MTTASATAFSASDLPDLVVKRIADFVCVTDLFWTNREILELADGVGWRMFSKYLYENLSKLLACRNTLDIPSGEFSLTLKSSFSKIKAVASELECCSMFGRKEDVFNSVLAAHKKMIKDYEMNPRKEFTETDREKILTYKPVVSLGMIKTFYGLVDKDLQSVSYELILSKKARSKIGGKIYDVHVIRALARKKYGTYTALDDLNKIRAKQFKEREIKREKERTYLCENRRNILQEDLDEYGLKIDSNCRLCNDYIYNGHGNPTRIAVTLNELRFYNKYTEYSRFLIELRYAGNYSRDEISNEAKILALRTWVHKMTSIEDALATPELPET